MSLLAAMLLLAVPVVLLPACLVLYLERGGVPGAEEYFTSGED
jgi:hypothetical protein